MTSIACKVVEKFICRFGVPLAIHMVQGCQFESALFQDICHLLDLDKTRATTFHPQTDGVVERMTRVLENMLSMFVSEHQKDWDYYMQYLLHNSELVNPLSTHCGNPDHNCQGREYLEEDHVGIHLLC